jgi:hypothetical protein
MIGTLICLMLQTHLVGLEAKEQSAEPYYHHCCVPTPTDPLKSISSRNIMDGVHIPYQNLDRLSQQIEKT